MFKGLARPRVIRARARTGLSRSGLPDLDYALNPYLGCWHSCLYCYAREYVGHPEASTRWGEVIVVRENIVELLQHEVRYKRRGVVGVGTITDAYQPLEALYKLTRRSIELLLKHGFQVSIQTKNTLVLRDLDILEEYRRLVDIGVTITSMDYEKARVFEPRAPPPAARARVLAEASTRGLETWIFMGPIIPGYNDDEASIEEILSLARETKSILYYDKLRAKKFMLHPSSPMREAAEKTMGYDWPRLERMIRRLCERYGVVCRPGMEYGPSSEARLDKYLGKPRKGELV
ncbi:MAG: radical SAM protein [Pyrodictiaceae archaeon]